MVLLAPAALPQWRRLLTPKNVICVAVRQTRDRMREAEGESGHALNITVTSAARAIARSDSKLAQVFIAR